MLNHIGITINDESEIKNFYQEILGFKLVKEFEIGSELAEKIFSNRNKTQVFLMEKDGLFLELFIGKSSKSDNYNHICLNVNSQEYIIDKAKKKYLLRIISRIDYNLLFILDKAGNIFELKKEHHEN